MSNLLRLGSNLVLAHVLFPEAFALTALAGIVLQALSMFSDIGIGPSIVRSTHGHDPAFLNTAWTIQILRGMLLLLASIALAWPMARFYNAPDLFWIVPACGLTPAICGFQSVALHLRARELRLGLLTFMELAESIVKTTVTVIWALVWPSVWAIVGGALVSYLLYTIATHVLLPEVRHRLALERRALKELLHFGGWVFVSTAVTFLAMQADRLILGRLTPLDVLGVYSIAYMFSRLPAEIVSRLAGHVQFAALAEVARRDRSQLEHRLLESRRVLLAMTQFGTVCVIAGSPWFFSLLYDDRYADAASFAPLLAGIAWLGLLQATSDRTLLALGDSRSIASSNLLNACVTIPACIAGHSLWGMTGFIGGVGLGNLAGHLLIARALAKQGVSIITQDLRFTTIVGACAILSFQSWVPRNGGASTALSLFLDIAAVLLSGVCLYRVGWPVVHAPLTKLAFRVVAGRSSPSAPPSSSPGV